jgi:hypothetical protein
MATLSIYSMGKLVTEKSCVQSETKPVISLNEYDRLIGHLCVLRETM